jgi:integrase
MITESQIKAALRNARTGGKKSTQLTDDGERGAGRLALLVRPFRDRATAEWYAIYYRAGKRVTTKISTYPTLSLGEARKEFREKFAPTISTGGQPVGSHARNRASATEGRVTVRELFEAYVNDMKRSGKRSWTQAARILLTSMAGSAVDSMGGDRPAAGIEPDDVVPFLARIHERGSVVMAGQARAYIGAAFAFGLASAFDYTRKGTGTDWGIKANPILAIKADAEAHRTRDRFLAPVEFRLFWNWLSEYRGKSGVAPAAQLMLATGQRAEEILRIGSESSYSAQQKMINWKKTKNGRPHSIPLPPQAVDILDKLPVNAHGLYFPGRDDAATPALHGGIKALIRKFRLETGTAHFMARDLRRSWKTLCGQAGISKDMRDRLQNHSRSGDVSSRHYDRYEYLVEKRAAVAQWGAYLDRILTGELDEGPTAEVISIGRSAAA